MQWKPGGTVDWNTQSNRISFIASTGSVSSNKALSMTDIEVVRSGFLVAGFSIRKEIFGLLEYRTFQIKSQFLFFSNSWLAPTPNKGHFSNIFVWFQLIIDNVGLSLYIGPYIDSRYLTHFLRLPVSSYSLNDIISHADLIQTLSLEQQISSNNGLLWWFV